MADGSGAHRTARIPARAARTQAPTTGQAAQDAPDGPGSGSCRRGRGSLRTARTRRYGTGSASRRTATALVESRGAGPFRTARLGRPRDWLGPHRRGLAGTAQAPARGVRHGSSLRHRPGLRGTGLARTAPARSRAAPASPCLAPWRKRSAPYGTGVQAHVARDGTRPVRQGPPACTARAPVRAVRRSARAAGHGTWPARSRVAPHGESPGLTVHGQRSGPLGGHRGRTARGSLPAPDGTVPAPLRQARAPVRAARHGTRPRPRALPSRTARGWPPPGGPTPRGPAEPQGTGVAAARTASDARPTRPLPPSSAAQPRPSPQLTPPHPLALP